MMDKKIKEEYNISIRDIRQIFEGASRITSSQLNIHLQILDYKRIELYYWYFPDPITLLEVMQSKAEEMYDKWVHFDHFILLHTNNFTSGTLTPYQPIFLENNACSKHSIGLLNIRDGDTRDKQVKVLPKDNLSRLIAKDVMWSVFRTFYSQSRCKCDDSSICLTEDTLFGFRQTNSSMASSCFKTDLNFLLTGLKTLDTLKVPNELRKGDDSHNYDCLDNDRPPGKVANRSISICGNGIREKKEQCDCFAFDQKCASNCDTKSCKFLLGTTFSTKLTSQDQTQTILETTTMKSSPENNPGLIQRQKVLIIVLVLLICAITISFLTIITFLILRKNQKRKHLDLDEPSTNRLISETQIINSF